MRTLLTIAFALLLVAAGLLAAHATGILTPIYHWLGWHRLAGHAEPSHGDHRDHGGAKAAGKTDEHVGHGAMPKTGGEAARVPGYSLVQIDPRRQQLIGVRTGKVVRDNLVMSIRTVGIIEPDQTRLKRIQTRVKGWVTKVHVNFVGQDVKKNDPLLEIYSPDLVSTQEEYLLALAGLEDSPQDALQKRLFESARLRLQLFGVPAEEIETLKKTRKSRETLTLRSPMAGRVLARDVLEGNYVDPAMELYRIADLSRLWLQAKIYQHEQPHIEMGQAAEVILPSEPRAAFTGKVSFVEPVLQEVTRTVKVRIEIDNSKNMFKPGMYADIKLVHPMGTGLLVPETAVLRTGERSIAFRALPKGFFEPVEVKLGARFGDAYEVLGGLAEGDEIVTSGNFLIDSDSRLKAATGMMGHGH